MSRAVHRIHSSGGKDGQFNQSKRGREGYQSSNSGDEKQPQSSTVITSGSTSTMKPLVPEPELKDPNKDYKQLESAAMTAARIYQSKQRELGLRDLPLLSPVKPPTLNLPVRTSQQPHRASSVASTVPTLLTNLNTTRNLTTRTPQQPHRAPSVASTVPTLLTTLNTANSLPVRTTKQPRRAPSVASTVPTLLTSLNTLSRPTAKSTKRSKAASIAPSAATNEGKTKSSKSEVGTQIASECMSCLEAIDPNSRAASRRLECCHRNTTLCQECFNKWVVKTMDTEGKPPQCPEEGCKSKLSHRDVTLMATGEALDKYEKNATLAVLQKTDEFYTCATPGCKNGQLMVDAKRHPRMDCPVCQKSSCVIHATAWHKGETCEQYEKRTKHTNPDNSKAEGASEKFIAQNSKPCPKCHVPIQRSFGCDNMKCTKCETLFCWYCYAVDEEPKHSPNANLRRWHFRHCTEYESDYTKIPTNQKENKKKGKELRHVPDINGDGGGIGDYRDFGRQLGHIPGRRPLFIPRREWEARRDESDFESRSHSSDDDDDRWIRRQTGNQARSHGNRGNSFHFDTTIVDERFQTHTGQRRANPAGSSVQDFGFTPRMQPQNLTPWGTTLGGLSLQPRRPQHDYGSGQFSNNLPYGYRQFPGVAHRELELYERDPDRWPAFTVAMSAFYELDLLRNSEIAEASWFKLIPMPSDINVGKMVVLAVIRAATKVFHVDDMDRQQSTWDRVLEEVYGVEQEWRPYAMGFPRNDTHFWP